MWPSMLPHNPKRLRVMTRMSQACTEVASSGGCWAVPRQGTWVDMTVEDTDDDDDDQDSGPEFVFNPVESHEEFDDVVNALERDLECHVGRKNSNGEESFHSAQRGSELLGPSASSRDQRIAVSSVVESMCSRMARLHSECLNPIDSSMGAVASVQFRFG